MKIHQLLENEQLPEEIEEVAIIFGRFNPPHQGHVAAWKEAAKSPAWYVGTNQDTAGIKDPLPYDIKIEAMTTLLPEVADHIVPEQSWWTLATWVYKKHGPVTLKVVTDEKDSRIFVKGLQDQNEIQGPHGFFRFRNIEWQEAPRVSSATDLRAAVEHNDPQKFEQAAGVPANTIVAGHPFFEVVKHYLMPYVQQKADKDAAKAQREQAKAEKERLKAEKQAAKAQAQQVKGPAQELAERVERRSAYRRKFGLSIADILESVFKSRR